MRLAFREGEEAAEWRRGTKTSERLRPYAAAESLGMLAGEDEPCVRRRGAYILCTVALTGNEPPSAGILNGICPHC